MHAAAISFISQFVSITRSASSDVCRGLLSIEINAYQRGCKGFAKNSHWMKLSNCFANTLYQTKRWKKKRWSSFSSYRYPFAIEALLLCAGTTLIGQSNAGDHPVSRKMCSHKLLMHCAMSSNAPVMQSIYKPTFVFIFLPSHTNQISDPAWKRHVSKGGDTWECDVTIPHIPYGNYSCRRGPNYCETNEK